MDAIWTLTKKELGGFFESLSGYIVIIAFLGFTGFFTWLYGSDIFIRKQADLVVFFSIAKWTLFFFIPAITMKLISEEKNTGTLELLLTKPINENQLVLGKFFAAFLLVAISLGLTLIYYISISFLGKVDHGAIISGYIGLLLFSAAYIGIGLFASSVSKNQIVAFLLALFIGIFFQIIFDILGSSLTGFWGKLFDFMSLSGHFDSISRGVWDTRDIIYFLSICILGIQLAKENLAFRR
ncbi:MAG TPA: ABC transporter permease [Bacteroidetes bacterium]|nr:ABC transporter permease [Bacteroidota bacterium]